MVSRQMAIALLAASACGKGGGETGDAGPDTVDAAMPDEIDAACTGPRCADAGPEPCPDVLPELPDPCDAKDGHFVYCLAPGDELTVSASLTYPPPDQWVNMGIGRINEENDSYIGNFGETPFNCVAEGGENAVDVDNNTAGRFCTVEFADGDEETIGTATYTITAESEPTPGDYLIGFHRDYDVASEPEADFYLRSCAP